MEDLILKTVCAFLKVHYNPKQPVLLAFSGGSDSLALLHLLQAYGKSHALSLALVHVDHGWREESRQEAEHIAAMAASMGLPLHQKRLQPSTLKGNLEAACREERLHFFRELCTLHNYQAVLLAHHADDQAETVLKRALEGASLANLGGLLPETALYGMKLWRPLLAIPKKKLSAWLAQQQLVGFHDSTNEDPRYLRARMRTTIIPQLSQDFGKEVNGNLCLLGQDAVELRAYLDQRVAPYLNRLARNHLGSFLDLSQQRPQAAFEVKHLIRCFAEANDFTLSRTCLDTAATLFLQGAANKRVEVGSRYLFIDRFCLFAPQAQEVVLPPAGVTLQAGQTFNYGPWSIHTSTVEWDSSFLKTDWSALWCRGGEVVLPAGNYELVSPTESACYPRNSPLKKWWSTHKVPAFMRFLVPVVQQNGKVYHEFLTGRSTPTLAKGQLGLKVVIR